MTPKEELQKIELALKTAKPHERKILEIRRAVVSKQVGNRDALDEMFGKGNNSNPFNLADLMDSLRDKK